MLGSSSHVLLIALLCTAHVVIAQYPSCFYEQLDEIEANLAKAVIHLKEAGYHIEFGNLSFPNVCVIACMGFCDILSFTR